jgi:hypothetical protein
MSHDYPSGVSDWENPDDDERFFIPEYEELDEDDEKYGGGDGALQPKSPSLVLRLRRRYDEGEERVCGVFFIFSRESGKEKESSNCH